MSKMNQHHRFEDADEVIEDAAVSSNLDDSICDADGCVDKAVEGSVGDPMSLEKSDDKTSADYYFDSYSHFGNFSFLFSPLMLQCYYSYDLCSNLGVLGAFKQRYSGGSS